MSFDVLLIVQYVSIPERSYYWVLTVSAPGEHTAGQKAKRQALKGKTSPDFPLSHVVVSGVGPIGCYQRFVGKYVGQFIDEAFPSGAKL